MTLGRAANPSFRQSTPESRELAEYTFLVLRCDEGFFCFKLGILVHCRLPKPTLGIS